MQLLRSARGSQMRTGSSPEQSARSQQDNQQDTPRGIPQLNFTRLANNETDGEELIKIMQKAQKKLESLADEFAAKQIGLQKQRVAAEAALEAELQVELAQNAVRSSRKKRSSTRPTTERLNVEEKLAALDRSRAFRPSRAVAVDGTFEMLEQERAELIRTVLALKVRLLVFLMLHLTIYFCVCVLCCNLCPTLCCVINMAVHGVLAVERRAEADCRGRS